MFVDASEYSCIWIIKIHRYIYYHIYIEIHNICLVWYSRQAPEVIGRDLLHISREESYFMNNKEV